MVFRNRYEQSLFYFGCRLRVVQRNNLYKLKITVNMEKVFNVGRVLLITIPFLLLA